MASKFFRGFSKVFKGPQNKGRVSTIGGVKPKAKTSDATKRFRDKVEATKKAIKKGTDDFKKQNPNRSVTDKQIKQIQREQTQKSNNKSRKEFLRERKMGGGMMGRPMYKKGSKKAVKLTDEQISRINKIRSDQMRRQGPSVRVGGKQPGLLKSNNSGGAPKKGKGRRKMMGGGMMGRPMYKKGSKKAVGKKSDFGMLSVKAGVDNNPNPTLADRIAGAKMKKKS